MSSSTRPRTSVRLGLGAALCGALVAGAVAAPAAAGHGRDRIPTPGRAVVVAADLGQVADVAVRDRRTFALATVGDGDLEPITVRVVSRGRTTTVAEFPDPAFPDVVDSLTWQGGRLHWTYTVEQRTEEHSELFTWDRRGGTRHVAFLGEVGYEWEVNPDAVNLYGFVGLAQSCLDRFTNESPFDPHSPIYAGDIDSRPGGATTSRGTVYLADAEANDVLAVDRTGAVRTVAVLAPVVAPLLPGSRHQLDEIPACAMGQPYAFEPWPQDVDRGKDGRLYVTVPSETYSPTDRRPLGSVVRVHPRTGSQRVVISGLVGPGDLEVGPRGELYVGVDSGIVVIPRGSSTAHRFLGSGTPVAVHRGALYVLDGDRLLRVPIRR